MLITSKSHQVSNGFSYFDDLSQPTEELGGAKTVLGNGKIWVGAKIKSKMYLQISQTSFETCFL